MAGQDLARRDIIGQFFLRLEMGPAPWVGQTSVFIDSDQDLEKYRWLGQSPAMREWLGGRKAKGLNENSYDIVNKHYEATLDIEVKDLRRDKTGQVMMRIDELADRSTSHWASLLSTKIINGESEACYDGQFYFDTDHSEGSSGNQSNDISVDISALPVTNAGSVTAPSVGEMQQSILQGVQKMYGFLDDQGEPMNETARQFLVMVPTSLWHVANAAISLPMLDRGEANIIPSLGLGLSVQANPRLDASWTDRFAVFRANESKALIRQQETGVELSVKGAGSEYEFDNDAHQYGIDSWRNVGYGFWQHACLVTMV